MFCCHILYIIFIYILWTSYTRSWSTSCCPLSFPSHNCHYVFVGGALLLQEMRWPQFIDQLPPLLLLLFTPLSKLHWRWSSLVSDCPTLVHSKNELWAGAAAYVSWYKEIRPLPNFQVAHLRRSPESSSSSAIESKSQQLACWCYTVCHLCNEHWRCALFIYIYMENI